MAIYRFRVTFEEHHNIFRDIEIKAGQTYRHFLQAISTSIGFDGNYKATFFMSDEHWRKGKAISDYGTETGIDAPLSLDQTKLTSTINDPHQKIFLELHAQPGWEFMIELVKITNEESNTTYPRCIKISGDAPPQHKKSAIPDALIIPPEFKEEEVFVENEDSEEGDTSAGIETPDEESLGGDEMMAAEDGEFGLGEDAASDEETREPE